MSKKHPIIITATMDSEYKTTVSADTIKEAIEKLITLHRLSTFEVKHYTSKGILQEEIDTGWYYE